MELLSYTSEFYLMPASRRHFTQYEGLSRRIETL